MLGATQEERLSRIKGDSSFPIRSIRLLLDEYDLTIKDIDLVCFYENPVSKMKRQFKMDISAEQIVEVKKKSYQVAASISGELGYDKEVFYSDHHMSHLGNGIYQSGWQHGSFLCADSVGEQQCFTWGNYSDDGVNILGQINFPDSLGILYSTMTSFLGFSVNDEEFKMMGLAAFGKPVFKDLLSQNLLLGHGRQFKLNMDFFNLNQGPMYNNKLISLLKLDPRLPSAEILQRHKDLASSIQELLEDELCSLVTNVFPEGTERLIFCGGVAHNSLASQKLSQLPGIKEVFIPAAPNDVGSSIGACVMAHLKKNGQILTQKERTVPYWGPSSKNNMNLGFLNQFLLPVDLLFLAEEINQGAVVAVCRGRMEFGDRALGNRSIIANPDFPDIKETINKKIKRREEFRPFAPIVSEDKASDYFEMAEKNKLMTKIYKVKQPFIHRLKGIQNIDGTARVQTVSKEDNSFFYDLLKNFERKSGIPILLNTSLNLNGEPIASSVDDALDIFLRSGMDIIVLEDYMLIKEQIPEAFRMAYRKVVTSIVSNTFKTTYDFL